MIQSNAAHFRRRSASVLFRLGLMATLAPLQFAHAQSSGLQPENSGVTPVARTTTTPQASKRDARDLIIGPEDSITIVLLDGDELSKTWRVGATGELNLPLVGRMNVAGMSVEDFQRQLGTKLRRYYKDPQLTVFISDYRSEPVTVTGAVEKPGTSQLEGSRTLFEVIMRAGGPKNAGDVVTLTRATGRGPIAWPTAKADGDGYSVATFRLADVMDGRSPAANMMVQPYDLVNLQEGKEKRMVHIIGDVNKPGEVELVTQNTVSLVKLLAIAGGLGHGASPTKTKIIHIGPDGSRGVPAEVNLKMILDGKALDLELTAGDVVIVPSGRGLKDAAQALAMSAATNAVWVGILTTL